MTDEPLVPPHKPYVSFEEIGQPPAPNFLQLTLDALASDPEAIRQILERSATYQALKAITERSRIEARWGPMPRTVLFKCSEACMLHYCNGCGTPLVLDDTAGDPGPCTPEKQGRYCFDCAHPGANRALP